MQAEISPTLFRTGSLNELRLKTYAFKYHQAGPRKGPLGLALSSDARRFERSKLFCTVFLPLACAAAFALLGALALIGWKEPDRDKPVDYAFVGYCVVAGLFMASFSEVPRQHLPVDLAISLHFVLRYASDWAFLCLVARFFRLGGRLPEALNGLYAVSVSLFVITFCLCALPHGRDSVAAWGLEATYDLVDLAFPLMLIGPLVAAWCVLRSDFKHKTLACTVFLIAAAFYLHDYLVCINVIQGEYVSKFQQILIASGFGIAIEHRRVVERARKETRQRASVEIGRLTAQVVHDIRSPLAAMRMVGEMAKLSEDERSLLRDAGDRITHICDGLLRAYRAEPDQPGAGATPSSQVKADDPVEAGPCHMLSLAHTVVVEVRNRWRGVSACEIDLVAKPSAYGVFCAVDRAACAAVLTNLLNNAVEAMDGGGAVKLEVWSVQGRALLRVIDNGRGMSPATLARLGEVAFTTGKVNGNGLGVSGAKKFAAQHGGRLLYTSTEGQGTCASLELPLVPAPSWFVDVLALESVDSVFVVDDDTSIHQAWQHKLRQAPVQVLCAEDTGTLRAGVEGDSPTNRLYVIDHEIRGSVETGLEMIESLGLGERAILVTGHANSAELQAQCAALGVGLLPKSMIAHLPLRPRDAA